MASNRIKGITIEIGGDTTKLDKALSGTDATLKHIQSDLKTVERQLKMDPGNAELIAQKHRLLGDQLEGNKDRFRILENAAKDAYKAFSEGKISVGQFEAFNLEMDLTRSAINQSEKALDDFGKSSSKLDGIAQKFSAAGGVVAGGVKKIAGAAAEVAKVGAAAIGAASAAMGVVVKEAVQGFSQYEQLVGGVETLFKSSSKTVLQYAQNAYKTAGLSANEYLDTVTSFSASLLQGLHGNTERAADLADLAITDMADNANKMGSDIASIQSAYQGFAKQNYTMLDNLKLGYGGTQEEMVRLINDSGILNRKIEDLNGIRFDQIVRAIHEVQTQMGITGTTALEASTTIQGSVSAVKAAWENLAVGLADENADIGQLVDNLVDSFMAALDNILPVVEHALEGIGEAIEKLSPILIEELPKMISELLPGLLDAGIHLITTLLDVIVGALPKLLPVLWDGLQLIVEAILSLLPKVAEAGWTIVSYLASAIVDSIPDLADAALEAAGALAAGLEDWLPGLLDSFRWGLLHLLDVIFENAPKFLEAAGTIVSSLVQGLIDYLPTLLKWIPRLITTLAEGLAESLPEIAGMAVDMIGALVEGLIGAIPDLIAAIPDIVLAIVEGFGDLMGSFVEIGVNIIKSIIDGIADAAKGLVGGIGDALSGIFGGNERVAVQPAFEPYSMASPLYENLPHLANGTVTRRNSPFLAVVGDNPKEPEVISPLSTIRQAVQEANAASGRSAGAAKVYINFTGDLAQLARVLHPQITTETQRMGPQLVN